MIPGQTRRSEEHSCRDCEFRTRWLLDLWEHRLRTGHADAVVTQ